MSELRGRVVPLFGAVLWALTASTGMANTDQGSTGTPSSFAPFGAVDCAGDMNADGLVDLSDFSALYLCVAGGDPPPPGCALADADGDGDVDLHDFAMQQNAFTGCRSCGACRDSVAVVPGETDQDYWRIVTPNAEARGALCNDGCPYVYYVRPGRNGNENKWLFFLKGGGGCATPKACGVRWRVQSHWMRPRTLSWRPPTEGILNPDTTQNPDWGDWTLVYLHYCSSDLFVGDQAAGCDTDGWHFRGRSILHAVLEDLQSPPEGLPSLDNAAEVMLTGGSAGAYGVIYNLDWIASLLDHASVVGVADSATSGTVVPELIESTQQTLASQLTFWNSQLDESCLAEESDPLACFVTRNVVVNHLATPCFVYQDQFDAAAFEAQRINGFCLEMECGEGATCSDDDACLGGLCMGPACDAATPCSAGFCNEGGMCYGDVCVEDEQCPPGLECTQGFCTEPVLRCADDYDCAADEFCLNSACVRSVACLTDEGCRPGETCIEDMALCVRTPGCETSATCGSNETCLIQMLTPYGQVFAADVRAFMDTLPHGYCTRWGSHVLLPKPRFFNGHVQGISYADVLANWYFHRPGRTHVVDSP